MTKRRFALMTIVIVLIALIMLILTNPNKNDSSDRKIPKPTPVPCSDGTPPCIAIQDANGKVFAKVNDFRIPMDQQGCIYYRVKTTDAWQKHCGGYNMLWIGPGNPPGKEGAI